MKILLHACCGPCTIYPVDVLRSEGHEVYCYFYNPNIHPFREFERRVEAMEQVSQQMDLPVVWEAEYGLSAWLKRIESRGDIPRCEACYTMRMEETACKASELEFDAFTSTLLYSRYQDHEGICLASKRSAQKYNTSFFYRDFRPGWKEGIDRSIKMGIYRQPYCGCIFSEYERYIKRAQRLQKRIAQLRY